MKYFFISGNADNTLFELYSGEDSDILVNYLRTVNGLLLDKRDRDAPFIWNNAFCFSVEFAETIKQFLSSVNIDFVVHRGFSSIVDERNEDKVIKYMKGANRCP
tara:strand:- start:5270 stop:5581 length:312 start_codon:yes stop_codon:yes gene_type:complete